MIKNLRSQKQHFSKSLWSRLLLLAMASPVSSALAFELAAGFAVVEEGDDRIRPGVSLHAAFNDFYMTRAYYYGREFGPVREETLLVSASRRFGILKNNLIVANLGACVMNERIALKFDATDATQTGVGRNRAEDNYNVGGVFGVALTLPKNTSPVYTSLTWDSHVFPAGLNGGLFLSSGRKQTIAIQLGVAL